ncbi:MAG: sigma-70 family RNA polymerase sigma factor [Defluviitaleaceae bacterium]|nr:sigma-70 family RNA polymerase sigma factor [Defluviitaleaceae bacterium]
MDILVDTKAAASVDITLEQMINAHGKAILRYCHLLLRDYHEAQDVVQTTFLKAFYSNASADYMNGELSPLLYKIAYNQCIDILRKRKRFFSFMEREKHTVKTFYQMEDGMSEEVSTALGTLNPKDRALVISRLIDDMDYDELSKIYNVSAATLRKRYERAKKRLAEALREQGLEGQYGKK